MKTSKIILSGIFVSVLIWITAIFFTATAKIKQVLTKTGFEQNTKKNSNNTIDKGKTVKLINFTTVVANGKGSISIEQSDKNSFQSFSKNRELPEIKNDTLFLPADDMNNYVYAVNLKTVILKGKVKAYISEFNTDTFNIKTTEKSQAFLNNLDIHALNVLTKDESSVKLADIQGNNIKTNLVLKDKSKIYINESDNLNLDIKKDSDAKIKISN